MNIVDGLIQHQIEFAKHMQTEIEYILFEAKNQVGSMHDDVSNYSENNYKLCANGLALLYKLKHPKNTLYGQLWLKDSAIKLINFFLKDVEFLPDGTAYLKEIGSEWIAYTVTQVISTLENEVDELTKKKAYAYVEAYVDHALTDPFFFTAYNHESWRCWVLYNAGHKFNRPEWCERALFFAHQLLEMQSAEGFWEESRHHGPSMKYNQLMLSPLAWISRLSGDQKIREAATRLSAFMSRWVFPDATTVGSFDGRQSTSLAMFSPVVPGLEFTQEGAELNRRGVLLWESRGGLSEQRALGNSTWYAHFASFSIADALWYYLSYPPDEVKHPLAIDQQNAAFENHSTEFNGSMKRWGSWVMAGSSQNSDVPRGETNVYRLDRQSRLELWHSSCGVVLGGGHNITKWEIPYANVILDTNGLIETNFGWIEPSKKRGGRAPKALYVARLCRSYVRDDKLFLQQVFGHATFLFECAPVSENEFKITVRYEGRGIKKMYLQMPMLLWRKGDMKIDGVSQDGRVPNLLPLTTKAEFLDTVKKTVTTVIPPANQTTKIRSGLSQIRSYGALFETERFDPPYFINMVSTEYINPPDVGSAEWRITITK